MEGKPHDNTALQLLFTHCRLIILPTSLAPRQRNTLIFPVLMFTATATALATCVLMAVNMFSAANLDQFALSQ